MEILRVDNLSKSFGGLKAINNVSFGLRKGAIKAVIGPNGAGKTTLFNLISGFLRPDSGSILFKEQEIRDYDAHRIARLGISRTFQHIRLFPGMTVIENVMMGRHRFGRTGFLGSMLNLPRKKREERETRDGAMEALRFVGIEELAHRDALELSYGQQRLVELARALALEPEILLLDEPAAGLNMRETAEMGQLIQRIRDRGITVLIVEHDMSLIMKISEEIVVLSYGEKIAEDVPLAIQKNEEVIRIYLGEEDAQDH
ncbi:MAG TPA: ABC transporter ATP-binding protein [Nitrospirae bacterium]|nr:ABC transporter ATP-binding protein [Nitrospirota bacterium]